MNGGLPALPVSRKIRVALAHDWLTGMRGGERVLEELCGLFPDAPIYTLFRRPGATSAVIESHPIFTSPLQRLPGISRRYRGLLPLFPAAVAAMTVAPCDLLLSTSHCAIKALTPPQGARHLCYVFTPMRYAWDQAETYLGSRGPLTRVAAGAVLPWLRRWDHRSNRKVDRFVSISRTVADRVARDYQRESGLVYPPVDLDRFEVRPRPRDGAYLMVTAFAPYKRVEVALEAFRRLKRRLRVVGGGQDLDRLRPLFGGDIEYLGPLPDAEVTRLYADCRAFVMPGEEDFGITLLEAQASGRPVIALARGGATETVVPLDGRGQAPTGVLYPPGADPTGHVANLMAAVLEFEAAEDRFTPDACRRQAERFSPAQFRAGLLAEIEGLTVA
jgi:glycosyltransferase involved in cell wall biosynthesis